MSEAIGIMNDAYFVGRVELIQWINSLLKLNISKVEQCCTGAIHCQIFDVLYPGKINMNKVNFDAKHEYEYVKNFKILQDVFDKADIKKSMPVERLIKGKYQDNLELLQWVYEFFNRNSSGLEYDPVKRRSKSKGGVAAGATKRKASAGTTVGGSARVLSATTGKENSTSTAPKVSTKTAQTNEGSSSKAELLSVKKENAELAVVLKELEKERDWYFSKILEVEKICKDDAIVLEGSPTSMATLVQKVLDVLYATDADTPNEVDPISIP